MQPNTKIEADVEEREYELPGVARDLGAERRQRHQPMTWTV